MRETTAEIWIGPNQSEDWIGTQGGINATHLMLLRENSLPAWLLLPGNLYDAVPPVLRSPRVWVPTPRNPVQDALVLFAVIGAKVPEVRAVFNEFEKSRNRMRLDLSSSFPRGLPKQVYNSCKRHLRGWHVILSVGSTSLANRDLDALESYDGLKVEIRTPRSKN